MTPEFGDHAPGAATRAEIWSQPEVWPLALTAGATWPADGALHDGPVLYIGCGSTAHLAEVLAAHHRAVLGSFAWAEPSAALWHRTGTFTTRPAVVVAISRSGETTETVEACRRARAEGAKVLAITTAPTCALSAVADDHLALDYAAEVSVCQTRSFTSMLIAGLAAQLCAADRSAEAALGDLAADARHVLDVAAAHVGQLADPTVETVYVLGSGFNVGLAREGALKIKEMSRTATEACSVLDFRHGPISGVRPGDAALVLCHDSPDHELAVAAELRRLGAVVVTIGSTSRCDLDLSRDGLAKQGADIAALLVCQLVGLERGLACGIDPDAPDGVHAYISL